MNDPNSNMEPVSGPPDTPKAALLNLVLKLISKAVMWFIRRSEQKEVDDENALQKWKNVLVEDRNSRVDRVSMARDAIVCASKASNHRNYPPKADPSDK